MEEEYLNIYNNWIKALYISIYNTFTVFLSHLGALLITESNFAQQLVQPPQHLVIWKQHNASFYVNLIQ